MILLLLKRPTPPTTAPSHAEVLNNNNMIIYYAMVLGVSMIVGVIVVKIGAVCKNVVVDAFLMFTCLRTSRYKRGS